MCLVEGQTYVDYHHLLEVIPLEHQLAFVELLQAGTDLRACFAELDSFLVWQETMLPIFPQYGIVLDSVTDRVTMYKLDKKCRPAWLRPATW